MLIPNLRTNERDMRKLNQAYIPGLPRLKYSLFHVTLGQTIGILLVGVCEETENKNWKWPQLRNEVRYKFWVRSFFLKGQQNLSLTFRKNPSGAANTFSTRCTLRIILQFLIIRTYLINLQAYSIGSEKNANAELV